jgi:hypothetical protein
LFGNQQALAPEKLSELPFSVIITPFKALEEHEHDY